jgi:hypothetical protein
MQTTPMTHKVAQLMCRFTMEALQYSGEIDIDGVVMKGTLPARLRWRIGTINIESQLFNLKTYDWQIGMIIYVNKENKKYFKYRWNEIFPFIVSAPCEKLRLRKNE